VGRLVRYRQSDLESWLRDEEHHRPRDPGPLLEPAKIPLTVAVADLLAFLTAIRERYGGDVPVFMALLDAQGQGTVVPLLGTWLQEGPEHKPTMLLSGQHPEAAGQGERPERPIYLQRTLYGTPDLHHLLRVLNDPSELEGGPTMLLVNEFHAHGQIPDLVELLNNFFREPVSDAIWLSHDDVDVQSLHMFTQTGGALHRWLHSKDPWRLKRCIECKQYFFDATKNGRKLHCSAPCSTRHGTRTYRARLAR
jgi:hypothetical protein